MSEHPLDNLFEKGLKNSEFPYREGAWEGAEKVIEEAEKGRRRPYLGFMIFGAALFISAGLGGLYSLLPAENEAAEVQAVEKGTEEPQAVFSSTQSPVPQPQSKPQPVESQPEPVSGSPSPDIAPTNASPASYGTRAAVLITKPDEENPELLDDGASGESFVILAFDGEKIEPLAVVPKDTDVNSSIGSKRRVPSYSRIGMRLDLVAGLVPALNQSIEGADQSLIPFYAGANFIIIPSKRIEIGIGAQYEQLRVDGVSREIIQREFSFGVNETVYTIDPNSFAFVSVPVYLAVKPAPRHRIKGGLQYSRMIRVQSTQTVENFVDGQSTGSPVSSTEEGYFSELNENSLSAIVGYEYKLKSRLGLDIRGRIGLTELQKNLTEPQQTFHLKVGLTYNLWGK